MATIHVHRDSFNAGELAPTIGSRFAVEKVMSGCRTMRNFYPHVHGPALRRPGMKYLGDAQDFTAERRSTLFPFVFSADTAAVLELSENGLGVWQDGERIAINPVDLPWEEDECDEVQMAQVNDVCYFVHKDYPPQKLVRWSALDWRLSELTFDWPPLGDENVRSSEIATPVFTLRLNVSTTAASLGTTYNMIAGDEWRAELTATASPPAGATCWIQRYNGSSWVDEMQLTITASATTYRRGRKLGTTQLLRMKWTGTDMALGTVMIYTMVYPSATAVTIAAAATTGTGIALTASSAMFRAGHVGSYWQITHRRDNAHISSAYAIGVIAAGSTASTRISGGWSFFSYGTWTTTVYLEKSVGGTWETVRSWQARGDRNIIASGEEQEPTEMRLRVLLGACTVATHFVLEASEARVNGLVKITAVGGLDAEGNATTATADIISELWSTAATSLWTEGSFSEERGFPRTITLHGGRLWFGGTEKDPQRIWGSVVNDIENFRRSTYDDAGVSFTPASNQSSSMQWMISFGENLVLGTSQDEWSVTGSNGYITPVDVSIRRRSGYGSAHNQAQYLGDSIVFLARDARHFRQLVPRTNEVDWQSTNLNTLADHLIALDEGIKQFAIQNSPVTILWAVLTDGKLLGLTYEREQNVFAWHRHDINDGDAKFKSVAVIPSATSSHVYFCNKHEQYGGGADYYVIDRFHDEVFQRSWSDAAYMDSYVNVTSGSTITSVTGLLRFRGHTPQIMDRGTGLRVANSTAVDSSGVLTKTLPAGSYRIGMAFTSELQMMRFDIPLRDGTSQGRNWKTNRVRLKMIYSKGGTIADSDDAGAKQETIPSGSLPSNRESEIAISATTRDGCDVIITTSEPYPLNIQSITWKGDISGE